MFTEKSYTKVPYKDIAYTIDAPIKSSPIKFIPTEPHSSFIPKSILKTSKNFNGQTPPPKPRFVCFNSNVMLNDDCNTLTICESSGKLRSKSPNKYNTSLPPDNLKVRFSNEAKSLKTLLNNGIIDENTFNIIEDHITPPDQKIELLLSIRAQKPQSYSEIDNLIEYYKNNLRTIHNPNPTNEHNDDPVVEHVIEPTVDPTVKCNLIIKDYLNLINAHSQELAHPNENSLDIFEEALEKIPKVYAAMPKVYISTEDQAIISCSVLTMNATYPTALKKHLNKVHRIKNNIKEKAGELLANNILEIPQSDVTLEQILDFIESSANLTKYINDEIEGTSISLSTDSLNLVSAVRTKLSRVYSLYYTKLYLPDKHKIIDPIINGSIDQSNVNNLIDILSALEKLQLKYDDLLTNVYTGENKQLFNYCVKLQKQIQSSLVDKCISNYNNEKHEYFNIIKPNVCKENAQSTLERINKLKESYAEILKTNLFEQYLWENEISEVQKILQQ